jgi:hypothetical protein
MKNMPYSTPALVLMIGSALAYPALAETAQGANTPPPSHATAVAGEKLKETQQFSQAGHSALLNIGDARLAIFDGDPKIALKLMESAKTLLNQAGKDAASMGADARSAGKSMPGASNTANPAILNVPVDGQLAVADDFVMTPEKKAHIDKANEHFKKGDHATGLEELKLAAIDVNYTRWWLPVAATETHLDQAIKLANENKYYEANLALKAIEDSVTMDSIGFGDLPATNKTAKAAS